METRIEFEGEFYKGPHGGIFIDFPFDAKEKFGKKGVIRIKVQFDHLSYRMSLLPRRIGSHYLHVRREIREALGKSEGDKVKIVIEADHDPPAVKLPEYLQWLLDDDPDMKRIFQDLSYSMKKQLVEYIEQPKTEDAKVHRVNRFFEILNDRKLKSGNITFSTGDEV